MAAARVGAVASQEAIGSGLCRRQTRRWTLTLCSRLCFVWLCLSVAAHVGHACVAQAQAPNDQVLEEETLETPRSLALGSGARATATGTTALAANVANMPLLKQYQIESINGYRLETKQWSAGGAIMDSVTSSLAAGFAARGILNSDDQAYKGFDLRLGLALPIGQVLAIGVAGRYMRFRPEGEVTPTIAVLDDNGEPIPDAEPTIDPGLNPRVDGFTIDAAVRLTLFKALHIAGLGYNLVNRHSPLVPQQLGGAASLQLGGSFNVGGDLLVDLSTFDKTSILTGGGIEYFAGGSFPLRAGYRFDSGRERHSIGAGVGYGGQSFGVEFGLRQDVAGASETRLLLSARYNVR